MHYLIITKIRCTWDKYIYIEAIQITRWITLAIFWNKRLSFFEITAYPLIAAPFKASRLNKFRGMGEAGWEGGLSMEVGY